MPSRRRSYLFVPLFIAVCSIAAGIFSGGRRHRRRLRPMTRPLQSLKAFTKVYDAVEQNFADPVKSETAIYQGRDSGHAARARSALEFLRSARVSRASAKTRAATISASA